MALAGDGVLIRLDGVRGRENGTRGVVTALMIVYLFEKW